MLKTLQIKLLPKEQQKYDLMDTFIRFSEACNFVSKIAFEGKLFNKVFLQGIIYKDIREKFGLSSQLAVRVVAKVVETYKPDRTIFHRFRDFGSIVHDQRILSFKGMDEVSINTTGGRIRIPITMGKYGEIPFKWIRGQCDLVRKNRPERSRFKCISCGFEGEADFVASLNIRNRAAVIQPVVTEAISIIRSLQLQAPKP